MASLARHTHPDQHFADTPSSALQETLDALLEITGATAGWIGLLRPEGQLVFPARRGSFSEAWLTLQQGRASVWGFAVSEGPVLLNDLPPFGMFGEPPLRNLLSCLLRQGAEPAGHVIVANKPAGFTSHDVTAVQTAACLLSRQLDRQGKTGAALSLPGEILGLALDQIPDGILVLDPMGRLLFANATWAQWTGYARAELCDRPAPFPFWVSHADLVILGRLPNLLPDTWLSSFATRTCPLSGAKRQRVLLPFRQRNHSLFWCQVETTAAEIVGRTVTIAFLRRLPVDPGVSGDLAAEPLIAASPSSPRSPVAKGAKASGWKSWADNAPQGPGMALLLRPEGVLDFWDAHWEELTGLTSRDLAGVSGELFLDWLLPRQADRNFVADLLHQPQRGGSQALLEIAGRRTNRRLLCLFLPIHTAALRQETWMNRTSTPKAVAEVRSPDTDAWLLWACPPTQMRTQ
jgi:PAS domain-containing protein